MIGHTMIALTLMVKLRFINHDGVGLWPWLLVWLITLVTTFLNLILILTQFLLRVVVHVRGLLTLSLMMILIILMLRFDTLVIIFYSLILTTILVHILFMDFRPLIWLVHLLFLMMLRVLLSFILILRFIILGALEPFGRWVLWRLLMLILSMTLTLRSRLRGYMSVHGFRFIEFLILILRLHLIEHDLEVFHSFLMFRDNLFMFLLLWGFILPSHFCHSDLHLFSGEGFSNFLVFSSDLAIFSGSFLCHLDLPILLHRFGGFMFTFLFILSDLPLIVRFSMIFHFGVNIGLAPARCVDHFKWFLTHAHVFILAVTLIDLIKLHVLSCCYVWILSDHSRFHAGVTLP